LWNQRLACSELRSNKGMLMVDYVKIRDITTQGKGLAADDPAYQAMLRPLLELVRTIFAENGLGQEVIVEVTLKITPTPRVGGGEITQRR
jgi:hypothetical protein